MTKLTPKQLKERLDDILLKYAGIQGYQIKFVMQLPELKELPDGKNAGAYWDSEYGVIVYSSNADHEYWEKYLETAVSSIWIKRPSAYARETAGRNKIQGRGRPPKDYSEEYNTMERLRAQGMTVPEIAREMGKTEHYIYRLKVRYQAQLNREMC